MPLVYSPIDGSELDQMVVPRSKSSFLMLHDNDRVSAVEATMQKIVREELATAGFKSLSATELSRSDDYLLKIIRMIQGCGFGVAIFSDATPAKTLANIFFEVGYCLALGKPTQLVLAGENAAPSDFVRSEWIQYSGDEGAFRGRLKNFLDSMTEYGEFFHTLAATAEEAEEPDPEIVYERYKRAFLISGAERELDGIRRVHKLLRKLTDTRRIGEVMKSNRRTLSDRINAFLRMTD